MKIEQFILPKNLRILESVGENIQLARLRRKMSSEQMAERAGISRKTVATIGTYGTMFFTDDQYRKTSPRVI